jgi:Protein of unknown function (DUF4013)
MRYTNLKIIIFDSLRYSISDLKMLLILGIVLLLADKVDQLSSAGIMADEVGLLLFSVIILLSIFEAGYVFKILEETIQGSKKLPQFNNFSWMFIHGIKELVVLLLYFSFPIFLFVLIFWISTDFNNVSTLTDILFVGFLCLTCIIYVFFPAVLLHRAHNNGDLMSSFDFRKIYHKIRSVGLKRLIIVYLGLFLLVTLVESLLSNTILDSVPVFGEVIPDLLIAPYLLIFTTRFLGLIDQSN